MFGNGYFRLFGPGQCIPTISVSKNTQKQYKKIYSYIPSARIMIEWIQGTTGILILTMLSVDSEANSLENT